MDITVIRRHDDFMAYISSNCRYWGCGRTQDEAVGSLIRNHPYMFGVVIYYSEN